jgi:hypothetical protein
MEENVHTCPLLNLIDDNGLLSQIFDQYADDKEIIRKWILDGSPLPQETSQSSTNPVQITSHHNFQFAL